MNRMNIVCIYDCTEIISSEDWRSKTIHRVEGDDERRIKQKQIRYLLVSADRTNFLDYNHKHVSVNRN